MITLQRISIEQPLKAGDSAPYVIVENLNGEKGPLTCFSGQPLAVLFFSVDCPHCKRELKSMETLWAEFKNRVQFLLITTSSRSRTKRLLDSLGISIPVATDEEAKARAAFGVFTVPALFLINTQGIIQTHSFGERSVDARRKQLESFLRATATGIHASNGSMH